MPYKLVPTAYDKVEMTEEEREHRNKLKRAYRKRIKEKDPEKFEKIKEKQRIRNKLSYQRRKEKNSEENRIIEMN
tara:strand:- start:41 stop:265 length:225 start_codon:yes stop_codon:yes gene_type:complete